MPEQANVNKAADDKGSVPFRLRTRDETFCVRFRDLRADANGNIWVDREAPTVVVPSVLGMIHRPVLGYLNEEGAFKTARGTVPWEKVKRGEVDKGTHVPVVWH